MMFVGTPGAYDATNVSPSVAIPTPTALTAETVNTYVYPRVKPVCVWKRELTRVSTSMIVGSFPVGICSPPFHMIL